MTKYCPNCRHYALLEELVKLLNVNDYEVNVMDAVHEWLRDHGLKNWHKK